MTNVLYFGIKDFQISLSEYLKNNSAFYVIAMCPVCVDGITNGIYVAFKRD